MVAGWHIRQARHTLFADLHSTAAQFGPAKKMCPFDTRCTAQSTHRLNTSAWHMCNMHRAIHASPIALINIFPSLYLSLSLALIATRTEKICGRLIYMGLSCWVFSLCAGLATISSMGATYPAYLNASAMHAVATYGRWTSLNSRAVANKVLIRFEARQRRVT